MSEKKAGERQIARVKDYQSVFGSSAGKRVLYDMMKAAHMVSPMMSRGARGEDLLFAEGERNTVLRVMTILKMNPQKLEQALNEGDEE